ncbi:MAG: hypothetical protein KKF41_14220 [Actinobacteria bacterium]|nr:hypothetical protein [Actinomycetota bacterium]MBU1942595.1 hypothetical protein [Actinomycetota bacterium]MBU2688729.1 hypothetical protein [Actinomycetota bacterium]
MNEVKKAGYAAWHKAVLIGCAVIAVLGTVGVIGMMVKISATITEYGGTQSPALYMAMVMMLLSVWLFAGSGALLVYLARMGRDIHTALQEIAAK